jgi:hypothetical protein
MPRVESLSQRPGSPKGVLWALLAAVFVSLLALGFDAWSRWEMVDKISAVSFAEQPPGKLPVSPGAREELLMLPHSSVDARWWVVHTRQMLREGVWRVRATPLDNAPEGREVHWSSFLMWVLGGLAWLRSIGTGEPAWHFVTDAALVAGPLLLTVLFAGLFGMAKRAFGLIPAMAFLLILLTANPVLRTFVFGEADHHGIVLAFATGSLLCLLAGGAGFAKKGDVRPARWFAVSGVLGAAALWVSASTSLPILAGAGAGAFLTGWLGARRKGPMTLQPGLWLVWAGWGSAASVVFYLLEYFPRHMGLRLEVNHPLYALAWLAGGWLLQRFLHARLENRFRIRSATDGLFMVCCVLAVAAPVLVILMAGERVFWVSDPFLLSLHKEYILEFQSLAGLLTSREQSPWAVLVIHFWALAALAGAGLLWFFAREDAAFRSGLLLLVPPTVAMQGLAWMQVRWGSAAFALWALWVLLIAAAILRMPLANARRRIFLAGLCVASWVALLVGPLPMASATAQEEQTCLDAPLTEAIGGNLLVRDIAHRLIQSSPGQLPVVLTGPNTSTELVFHSGLRTLGTLYWENMPGLKRAAEIFAATTEEDTKNRLSEAGVTHIVVPSWSNFGAAYADLLAKSRGLAKADPSYLDGVLKSEEFPVWLRPFAYPIPTASGIDSQSVRIIAFIPAQNVFESWLYRGIYHMESGQPDKARTAFDQALALRPGEPRVRAYLQNLPPPTNP